MSYTWVEITYGDNKFGFTKEKLCGMLKITPEVNYRPEELEEHFARWANDLIVSMIVMYTVNGEGDKA